MTTMTLDQMFQPTFQRALPTTRGVRSRVRLTRRGRVVVFLAALLVAFVVGVFVSAAGSATEHPGTPAPTRIIQVHDGDTMWDIASSAAKGGDVRQMMTTIEHLNALDSGDVFVGQRLVVPAS